VVVADAPLAEPQRLAGASEHVFPDGSRALVGPGLGDWVRLEQLPPMVALTWVAAEDSRFFTHRGFDLGQIARSLEVDLREARFARGGSTISQQLVKNAFLTPRRSLDRKLQEAILTWRVESTLDKRTILERYLNVIELGPGIHGISAAARHWFGKPPALLSAREVAFLAAMTPEPQSMSRRLAAAGGLDPQSAERVDTVLRAMRRAGVIRAAEADAARGTSLALRPAALRAVERR
jgi:membrane peptidoglycan carboxypeptidase